MPTSAHDHPWLGALLGDPELGALLSADAELQAMLRFEVALASAQAEDGLIPVAASVAIAKAAATFKPDHAALAAGALRDGLVVPECVKQLRAAVGAPHNAYVHYGSTSQDVLDTALMLRLRSVIQILDGRLSEVIDTLKALSQVHGRRVVMGRTRMQDALPIPLSYRLQTWRVPLEDHRARLGALAPRLLRLQCGGAVGIREKFDSRTKSAAMARRLAKALDLGPADPVWQATRERLVEFGSLLALISGSLGKLGQDIVLMAQTQVGEARITGAGGSSAMPHKQNPIAAEVLVALARHNATLAGGLQHVMVHEGERSGSAWTLEWLTLPPMVMTTGASTRLAARALSTSQLGPTAA